MKITVINGTEKHGVTYRLKEAFLNELRDSGEITEFFLPKDCPNLCAGCMNCVKRDEQYCKDREYIAEKGIGTIRGHATDIVAKRLSAENPENDGKQTPMKGHPVFIAQHATACCCRSCLEKWHHIPAGKKLTADEQSYIADVLMDWIQKEA